MALYQVSFNPSTYTATVQLDGATPPSGSTKVGTFEHGPSDDPLEYLDGHVIFHHVRDILYKTKPSSPPVTGFFPDNITDMQRVIIADQSLGTPPVNTVEPSITGNAKDGETLTGVAGTWTGTATITYIYVWERSANGTSNWNTVGYGTTYVVVAADVDNYLRLKVVATNPAGFADEVSDATSVVIAAE